MEELDDEFIVDPPTPETVLFEPTAVAVTIAAGGDSTVIELDESQPKAKTSDRNVNFFIFS